VKGAGSAYSGKSSESDSIRFTFRKTSVARLRAARGAAGSRPSLAAADKDFSAPHADRGTRRNHHDLPPRGRQACINDYGSQPDTFAALGYDAARLLMSAIRQAGSVDLEAVRRALGDIHEFSGVTGTLRYPQGSRIPEKSVSVLQLQDGESTLFRTLVPDQVPAP